MSDSSVLWVTGITLQALARSGATAAGQQFTARQLHGFLRGALKPEQRVHATTRLCSLGFLQHKAQLEEVDGHLQPGSLYTITTEGAQAIAAAAAGHVHKSGPRGPRERGKALPPGSLADRLWKLVRVRKVIDSETAARTLCDAGDPDAFRRTRDTCARTLRHWELAGALQAAARRVAVAGQARTSNGNKRYVLITDAPQPPRWWPQAQTTTNPENGAP